MKLTDDIGILLLDDHPQEAGQLIRQLEREIPSPVRIIHAATAGDALQKVREGGVRMGLISIRNGALRSDELRRSFIDHVPFLPLVLLVDSDRAAAACDIETGALCRVVERNGDLGAILETIRSLHSAEKEGEAPPIGQQAFYRSILDSLLDMISVLDATGRIQFVNRPWREIQASDDLPPCLDGHPGDQYPMKVAAGLAAGNRSLQGLQDGLAAVLENREARWEAEISSWTAAGRQWFLATITRLIDGEGRIVVSLRNITDRKRLEESLAELSTAVEQSPACIVITDLAGNIEYVNPRFEQLTGYTTAEVRGKNPRILQSGETPRETYEQLWVTLLTGAEWRGIFRNRKKNGELYWENAVVSPIRNPEGEIAHYVAVKEDITLHKEMQEELIAEKLRVEHAGRVKEIFIANMSHEIRTPLTAILGYAELLQMTRDGGMSEPAKQHLQCLKESSNRLLRTIENILHFSAIETGTLSLTMSTINLTRELAYLTGSMSETAEAKGISLAFENEAGEAYIHADERSVSDSFQNLLDNALKFTEKGKIVVNLRREKNSLVVSIQDTGVGIAPEYQPQLFDMFTQEGNGYARKSQGLGLGLALSRRYIEANGGTISILSRKHVGTIAYVRFPEAQYPVGDAAAPDSERSQS